MTMFGDQLYQFGGMPVDLPYSFLKGPKGKTLFVAPYRTAVGDSNGTNANDSNPGTLDAPLKTIARAYALCSGNLGEVIYLMGFQNAAAGVTDDLSATLTWAKNAVHLVGLVPPMAVSHRVRIGAAATPALSPMIDITGNNNVFANFQAFHGQADATALLNVRVTGQRNFFDTVHFAGIGDATQSAAGCASLALIGGDENVFKNCVIGLDTTTVDADGVNLLCDTDASRNKFIDCLFQAFISSTAAVHVKLADTTAIDRWLWFKNCLFVSESVNKTIDMAEVFNVPAGIAQGKIILQDCAAMNDGGAPVWTAGTEGIVWANMAAPTASAAGGLMTNL